MNDMFIAPYYETIIASDWKLPETGRAGIRYLVRGELTAWAHGTQPHKIVSVGMMEKDTSWFLELSTPFIGKFVCTGIKEFPTYD